MVKRAEGCRLLHIAEQINTDGVITFGKPEAIVGLESITLTNGYAEAQAYSDNLCDTNIKKPSFVDIAVVLRELSTKLEAKIMGQKYVDGKKVSSSTDTAPRFALLYQQTNSDGTYTNKVLYNVGLARDAVTNTTIADAVTFDTVALTGKAIPLSNGLIDLTIESDDADAKPEDLAGFFNKVIMPSDEVEQAVEVASQSVEDVVRAYSEEVKGNK